MRKVPADLDTDAHLDAAGAWCLKLADGTLEPAERAGFQAWLEADPENRRALEDAVGVWRAVGDTSLTPELLALRRDALGAGSFGSFSAIPNIRSRRRISAQTSSGFTPAETQSTVRL